MKNLFCKDLDAAVCACTKTLIDNQRHVGEDVGWHQHLGTNKIGIVATAIALLYYKMIGEQCRDEEQCLSFLIRRQNDDGGWPYISNTNGASNVESTCWALQALYAYSAEGANDEIINRCVDWILGQHAPIVDSDSGWAFVGNAVSRVYITALVLRTLSLLGKHGVQEFESAKQWLLNSQNEDGGWGELADRGSSFFFTSFAVIALMECGCQPTDGVIKNAKRWFELRLNGVDVNDASLLCYMEFIENKVGEDRIRISFFHYVLPYVICACIRVGIDNRIVFDAIRLMQKRMEDGEIEHPMLENSKIKPIWALYDSVKAVKEFEGVFKDWSELNEIILVHKWFWSFGTYNPLRFLVRFSDWIIRTFVMAIVFYAVFVVARYYWDGINQWFVGLKDSTYGGILMSLIAAVISSGASWGWKKVKGFIEQ